MSDDQQKPNIIDIRKFFGGKSLSSADIKVNKTQVLKTQPSFIAAPELASLLDVVATSVEDKNNYAEKIKSDERLRVTEIARQDQSDSRFQSILNSLTQDVNGLRTSYDNIIETLNRDRKLREKEAREREDYIKRQSAELSKERVGESLPMPSKVQPGQSFTEDVDVSEDTGEVGLGKLLGAASGLGLISMSQIFGGSPEDYGEEPEGDGKTYSGGNYDATKLTQLARSVGMPENKIPTMVAIALAESGGDSAAHNPDASTGDNSYGLWQINMLGDLGPDRRQKFGIKSNEELFDPVTNAKAAKYVMEKGGGLKAWSTYKGEGKGAYAQFLESANKAYQTTKAEPAKPKPAPTTSSTNTTSSPETQSSVDPQEPTTPPTEPSQEVSETSAKSNETQVAVKEREMEPKVLQASNTSAAPPVIVIPGQQGTQTTASQPSKQLSEDLAFFSSTNPENLYMFSNLRELNLV